MSTTPSTWQSSTYSPFPSDFVDPAEKKLKKYNLDYAKAAYFEYVQNAQLLTATRRNDFIDNRLYASGNQNNVKYKKLFTYKDETDKKEYSYVDLDYTPVSVIPGYRDVVLSYLLKQDYDIDIAAIDPISDNTRNWMTYNKYAEKTLNTILQQNGAIEELSQGEGQELFPETREELEIFQKVCFKLKWEMAMKGIVDLDFERNDWKEIKIKLYEDLFDNGIAGVREFTTKDGVHMLRYVDPVNMYIRQTRDRECKGSTAIGEMTEMTLSDFVSQSAGQFTQEEYMQIAKTATRPYSSGNTLYDFMDTDALQSGSWMAWYVGRYGQLRLKVFDLAWLTIDKHFYEEKTNPSGDKMIYEKPYGYKSPNNEYYSEESASGMKYYKKDINTGTVVEVNQAEWVNNVKQGKQSQRKAVEENRKMVYGAKWIVGTDYIYDYGLQYDLPRDPMPNGRETNLPFHIYRLTNKSLVERMKPFADAYMLTWLKIQNAKAKARPKGIKIELDSLENMTIAGKTFTPLQALSVYDQTGNIIYKGTGQFGEATRHSPVEELQGGMGAEYQQLIQDLNFNVQMIREVTGFNEIFLAASPDPNMPVKTAEMAVQSTSNALFPLQSALQNIYKRAYKSTICRFQIMSRYKKLQGYDLAISDPMKKVIEHAEDMSFYQFGEKLIIKPTQEQKNKIETAALQAMNTMDAQGNGRITYPDYLFIMRILDGGNMRYAEEVLAHRIQRRMQQYQAQQQQMIQVNAQSQMESNAAAEEEKRKTLTMTTDEEIRLAYAKGDIEIMVLNGKMEGLKDIERIKAGGKIEQTKSQSATKIVTTSLQMKQKKEDAKKKVPTKK